MSQYDPNRPPQPPFPPAPQPPGPPGQQPPPPYAPPGAPPFGPPTTPLGYTHQPPRSSGKKILLIVLAVVLVGGLLACGLLMSILVPSLNRARELEAFGFLQLTLAANEKLSWTGGFAIVN